MPWRMCASRCASSSSRGVSVRAQRRHRLQDAVEEADHVAPLLDLALPPEFVVVVARRLRQQRERIVARRGWSLLLLVGWRFGRCGAGHRLVAAHWLSRALASGCSGSSGSRASWIACGRSMKRTGSLRLKA